MYVGVLEQCNMQKGGFQRMVMHFMTYNCEIQFIVK